MAFNDATRREVQSLPGLASNAAGGNTVRVDLPRVGIASHILLSIRGSYTNGAAPGLGNALGEAAFIRNVRLSANNGNDIFNMSGVGYNHLLRPILELGDDPVPQNTSLDALNVTGAAVKQVNMDMIIPLAINLRDPIGLIMLQSDQTLLTLQITFESAGNMHAGDAATWAVTVTPHIVFFTVPANRADWPPFNLIHQIIEDNQVVPAAGTFTYNWPRSDIYIQTIHGMGIGAAATGVDNFSQVQLRMQNTTYLVNSTPDYLDIEHGFVTVGLTRRKGVVPFNFMGTTGLGVYDLTRDTIDSSQLTDLATVFTALAPGTLYTVRRTLVPLQPAQAATGAS